MDDQEAEPQSGPWSFEEVMASIFSVIEEAIGDQTDPAIIIGALHVITSQFEMGYKMNGKSPFEDMLSK